jgi:hypothetical protein
LMTEKRALMATTLRKPFIRCKNPAALSHKVRPTSPGRKGIPPVITFPLGCARY